MMTAPVALGTLIGLTKVSWGGIMAGAVMLTAPMLVVFVLLQRHFIAGICRRRGQVIGRHAMAGVSLKNVVKRFGAYEIIHGANLEVADGEFVVFVGPSGCGKSTLLRMIAGLEDITGGEIAIGGKVVNDVEPAERGIAMVFQSYALYPHMTVEQNLGFGLRMTGNAKADIAAAGRSARPTSCASPS